MQLLNSAFVGYEELKGRDNRKQIVIFKKVTTCFNFKDMFRCCQHHRQLQNIWKTVRLYNKLEETYIIN